MAGINYIVFLIDSKYKEHDGMLFKSYAMAKEWCKDVIKENYADKIVIGTVSDNQKNEKNPILLIETFGFKKDAKNFEQLEIFN